MPRGLVPGVFLALAIPTGVQAGGAVDTALANATARHWMIALYFLLRLAIGLSFAAFTFSRVAPHRNAREPLAFLACAAAVLLVLPVGGPGKGAATELVVAGDALAVIGSAWLLISVLVLGSCFGVLPEARGLVRRGPYRLVRHPVYLGEIVVLAGLTLAAPKIWAIAALALFVAAQIVRMGLEERALAAAFPEYKSYAAATGRVVPRLRLRPRAQLLAADCRPARSSSST